MSKLLASDYIMKFKNENEIRAHFKRYNNLRELKYTEEALPSELSHYALERDLSEIDYQLVIEKYGMFHKVILETLGNKMEEVSCPFWKENINYQELNTEETHLWLQRLDNIAGMFTYLASNNPKSFKEELRTIFQLQQNLNIHLAALLGSPS